MILLLRSLAYALIFYVGTVPIVLTALALPRRWTGALRAVVFVWCRYHRWCARVLVGITSEVSGVIPDGPVLFAVRHESFYETLEAPLVFGAPAIMAKRELTDLPLWGPVARRYGLIPVDRAGGAGTLREMLRAARGALAGGRSILIYPEGTRVPHGRAYPLQPGFAGLYGALRLPVVPVAINSGPHFRRFIKRPGVIRWRVAPTIPAGLPRDEVEARVAAALLALNQH